MKIKTLSYLVSALILSLFACGQATVKQEDKKPVSAATVTAKASDSVEQIIFGVFCGECGNHCATMYSYHRGGNANTLWVDYTDSYFKKGEDGMVFETQITDPKKYALA